MRYFITGTLKGNPLEETTRTFKDNSGKERSKTGYFCGIENPKFFMYDDVKKEFSLADYKYLARCLAEDMHPFIPKWVENLRDDKDIEYVNLSSQFEPKLTIKSDIPNEKLILNNAHVICAVNNTYINSVCVLENGTEWNPFDDAVELPFN